MERRLESFVKLMSKDSISGSGTEISSRSSMQGPVYVIALDLKLCAIFRDLDFILWIADLWNPILDSFLRLTGIKSLAFLRSHWSIFSIVHSWLAFGTIFKNTGGYWKSGTSLLKRATRRIFTISNLFHVSRNFILDFINKNSQKNFNTSFFQKILFGILWP